MKKLKKENNLMKENDKMNRQPVALSDEMLEQVSGGQTGEVFLEYGDAVLARRQAREVVPLDRGVATSDRVDFCCGK